MSKTKKYVIRGYGVQNYFGVWEKTEGWETCEPLEIFNTLEQAKDFVTMAKNGEVTE